MNRTAVLIAAAGLCWITPAQAPASARPCRDKDGKVIACPKPPRAAVTRCKDAKGRFVACAKAAAEPSARD